MIREYAFECADCMECTERGDCDPCSAVMEELLMRLDCVGGIRVDMAARRLCIETDGSDDTALGELLEDAGIAIQGDSNPAHEEDRQEEKLC